MARGTLPHPKWATVKIVTIVCASWSLSCGGRTTGDVVNSTTGGTALLSGTSSRGDIGTSGESHGTGGVPTVAISTGGVSAVATLTGAGGSGGTAITSEGGATSGAGDAATSAYGCEDPSSESCPRLTDCTCEPQDTTVTGTVLAPNGTLPIPNAVVYVPRGGPAFPYGLVPWDDGVAQGAPRCYAPSNPLTQTQAREDGSFSLTRVPTGSQVPLVIQLGHFRRVVTIPAVTPCSVTQLDASLTTLPSRQAMGNALDSIPRIAVATGAGDAFECVLRKFGIEDSAFSNGGGEGRIHLYRDNGAICPDGRASCAGTTPDYHDLIDSQETLERYDALVFPCDDTVHAVTSAEKGRVLDNATLARSYVNQGGTALFTHLSYAWLYDQSPLSKLPWRSTTNASEVDSTGSYIDAAANALVDTTSNYGFYFAAWLGLPSVHALSVVEPPTISVVRSRWNLQNPTDWTNLSNPIQRWMSFSGPTPGAAMLAVTVDMPWGSWPGSTNGRIVFTSLDVTASPASCAATTNGPSSCRFPDECDTDFTPQEKALAYLLFDMTNCGLTPPQYCLPRRCAEVPEACSVMADGCGGVVDCGACCSP